LPHVLCASGVEGLWRNGCMTRAGRLHQTSCTKLSLVAFASVQNGAGATRMCILHLV
jgi:hypothetical protein